jgi:hypothetical protein
VSNAILENSRLLNFKGKKVMKSSMTLKSDLSRVRRFIFLLLTFAVMWFGAALLCGCSYSEQPGETVAEGRRRHQRVLRINRQEMMADIDRAFLLDQPSKLTDKRIP